jgi:hypothetical protein
MKRGLDEMVLEVMGLQAGKNLLSTAPNEIDGCILPNAERQNGNSSCAGIGLEKGFQQPGPQSDCLEGGNAK